MLLYFLHNHADTAIRIRQMLEDGNREAAVNMAHSMKSTSGTLGADKLMTIAKDLEKDLMQEGLTQKLLEDFEQELRFVIKGLESSLS